MAGSLYDKLTDGGRIGRNEGNQRLRQHRGAQPLVVGHQIDGEFLTYQFPSGFFRSGMHRHRYRERRVYAFREGGHLVGVGFYLKVLDTYAAVRGKRSHHGRTEFSYELTLAADHHVLQIFRFCGTVGSPSDFEAFAEVDTIIHKRIIGNFQVVSLYFQHVFNNCYANIQIFAVNLQR